MTVGIRSSAVASMSALTKELNKSFPPRTERVDKTRHRAAISLRGQDQPNKLNAALTGPNDRLLFILQALIGQSVRVQVAF